MTLDTLSAPALIEGASASLIPPAHGEIWPGQGGIFICTIAASKGMPAHHLVASTAEAEDLPYGPYPGIDVPGATSQLDGAANTVALIAAGDKHKAARWAAAYTADGHTDFHLPSRHDLLMAYIHAPQHFNKRGWYWSSTQNSRYGAFVQAFEDGRSHWSHKDNEYRVRAFRWVHLNA